MISGHKSKFEQPYLFEERLGNHGHVRNVIGALVEKLTAKLVGGVRHKTDSRAWYCPDISAQYGHTIYYEAKAAGRSKQTFIYAGRLAKDRDFVAQRNKLIYVIWHHLADSKEASTVNQLQTLLLWKMRAVYVVPFQIIDSVCTRLTVEPLNSKYGGTDRATYGSGYRISLSKLDRFLHHRWPSGVSYAWLSRGSSEISTEPETAGL